MLPPRVSATECCCATAQPRIITSPRESQIPAPILFMTSPQCTRIDLGRSGGQKAVLLSSRRGCAILRVSSTRRTILNGFEECPADSAA